LSRFDLSRAAQSDLNGIVTYSTERWGRAKAREYTDALRERLTALAQSPLVGRARDDLADGLLCFPFESHVIFYQRAAFGITVVRILHKRQGVPAKL
jgi:toxin ParE1/3/4